MRLTRNNRHFAGVFELPFFKKKYFNHISNIPTVKGAVYVLRFLPTFYKVGFNRIVRTYGSQMFVTKTARELLFDGYEDPLLDLASKLPPGILPPFDKFAWFYQVTQHQFPGSQLTGG